MSCLRGNPHSISILSIVHLSLPRARHIFKQQTHSRTLPNSIIQNLTTVRQEAPFRAKMGSWTDYLTDRSWPIPEYTPTKFNLYGFDFPGFLAGPQSEGGETAGEKIEECKSQARLKFFRGVLRDNVMTLMPHMTQAQVVSLTCPFPTASPHPLRIHEMR